MSRFVGVPLGWEWEDPNAPAPSPEMRQKKIGDKNWAQKFKDEDWLLYHGTSSEAAYAISKHGMWPRPEWGMGQLGIFVWNDFPSALNWANYWFGNEGGDYLGDWIVGGGAVIKINPEYVDELRMDWDSGNVQWKGVLGPRDMQLMGGFFGGLTEPKRKIRWDYSQSLIIMNPIPPEAIVDVVEAGEFVEEVDSWEETVDDAPLSFRPPIPQFTEFVGEEGPGWALPEDDMEEE